MRSPETVPVLLANIAHTHLPHCRYHAVSKDMVHWAHLPVALTPDHDYDCGGEFSGSATVLPDAEGTPVLSVSVACGKWVFFAIPEDKKADRKMVILSRFAALSVSLTLKVSPFQVTVRDICDDVRPVGMHNPAGGMASSAAKPGSES